MAGLASFLICFVFGFAFGFAFAGFGLGASAFFAAGLDDLDADLLFSAGLASFFGTDLDSDLTGLDKDLVFFLVDSFF